jgi:hypothetical protein
MRGPGGDKGGECMKEVLEQIIANLADAEICIEAAIRDADGEERKELQDQLDRLDRIIDRLQGM